MKKLSFWEKIFSIVTCDDRRFKRVTIFGKGFLIDNKKYLKKKEDHSDEIIAPMSQGIDNLCRYNKFDVLFFSVISYSLRYQRPQQIADYYARSGHRTFYFNVDFGIGSHPIVKETHDNLFEVTLCFDAPQNFYLQTFDAVKVQLRRQIDELLEQYNIVDSVVISEYPNWLDVVRYLKHTYSTIDVVDYLDDWDGFEGTTTSFLSVKTKQYLKETDLIIATSAYLEKKAKYYNEHVVLVRNGTEFKHFNQIYKENEKEGQSSIHTVGYYGAISHWFDIEKIRSIAESLPNVCVELIGHADIDLEILKGYKNIKFLGEKPYKELPQLIAHWDVCLIPFDTSTDLIKATNPVKFYEYLSAGKKVVATEIPEIQEFEGKYVLLANDNAQFVKHVKACLDSSDGLASPSQRVKFAEDNDWQRRITVLNENIIRNTPKISIVVLTYNNLNYTKACINSIVEWTAYPNYELIIVDNASSDGTPEYLKEFADCYPQAKVILNNHNAGFAAGNNIGIKKATGDYVILLNNDTIVSRGWLSRILAHFRRDKSCGVVGTVTNSIGNEAMVQVGYTSLSGYTKEATDRLFKHAFEYIPSEGSLAMFAFAFPRQVIDEVGYISEEYGLGMFEDDDFCMAIKKMGYNLYIANDVLIHHFLSVSFGDWKDNQAKKELFERNREIFEKKWKTKWSMHKYRYGITADYNLATINAYNEILSEANNKFNKIHI